MSWTSHTGDTSEKRDWGRAMRRGLALRCPACGQGRLFTRFTRVAPACSACGEDFTPQQADDAPPYIVMMIVGHVVVGASLMLERNFSPSLTTHLLIAIPLTLVATLALLTPVKGAVIGLQWAHRMHGFGDERAP